MLTCGDMTRRKVGTHDDQKLFVSVGFSWRMCPMGRAAKFGEFAHGAIGYTHRSGC